MLNYTNNTTSRHLPLLQGMFPNKILLGVDDVAKAVRWSKSHIYNLSSIGELPFQVVNKGGRLYVSILELADYLDGKLSLNKQPTEASNPLANAVVIPSPTPEKRGRGRPRKEANLIRLAFQAELRYAISQEEMKSSFDELFETLNKDVDFGEEISKNDVEELILSNKEAVQNMYSKFREVSLSLKLNTLDKEPLRKRKTI